MSQKINLQDLMGKISRSFKKDGIFLILYILVLLPSLLIFISMWENLSKYYFPPWNDGGVWLKNAYALIGETYPMWDQTTLQYPPLFPALVILMAKLFNNDLLGLKVASMIALSTIPISTFLVTKELCGSEIPGIVAAWLVSFHPALIEMYGWGGYPNLLGLTCTATAFYLILKLKNSPGRKPTSTLIIASLAGIAVILSHHLTTMIFLSVFLSWILLLTYLQTPKQELKPILTVFSISIAAFIILRISAGSFQYLIEKPFYPELMFNWNKLIWLFKNPFLLALTIVLAILGFLSLHREGRGPQSYIILLWIVLPFLLSQSYLAGAVFDFVRFPIYSIQPMLILSAAVIWPPGLLGTPPLTKTLKTWVLVISLTGILIFSTISIGQSTITGVFRYYDENIIKKYGDRERLQVLDWIRKNTSKDALFIADQNLGRWIEGYSHRRALFDIAPGFIFIKGELWRVEMHELAMNNSYMIRNDFVRLAGTEPYNTTEKPHLTTTFSVSEGLSYREILDINDAYALVNFTKSGSNWTESPYASRIISVDWAKRAEDEAVFRIVYETQALIIEKTLRVEDNEATAEINYVIKPKLGTKITSLSISIFIPWEELVRHNITSANSILIDLKNNHISITYNGNLSKLEFGPDPLWRQHRARTEFLPMKNMINATVILSVTDARPYFYKGPVRVFSFKGLTNDYKDIFFVLPFSSIHSVELFNRDPRFEKVYENNRIIIFKYCY